MINVNNHLLGECRVSGSRIGLKLCIMFLDVEKLKTLQLLDPHILFNGND